MESLLNKLNESRCPKCKTGVMKTSTFRTGSIDNPGAKVEVCKKCGYRIETSSIKPLS